jgi:aminoglycoside 2'-N-acetyltransferase I
VSHKVRTFRSQELSDERALVLRDLFEAAWPDQTFSDEDWHNALGGVHFVLEDGEARILTHASVVTRELQVGGRPFRTGYVEAMATWPDRQRRGFGTLVLGAVNNHISSVYELGGLDTGSPGFYESLGWQRWRGPTFVRTLKEATRTPEEDGNVMVLVTPQTGELDLDESISCEWRPGEIW